MRCSSWWRIVNGVLMPNTTPLTASGLPIIVVLAHNIHIAYGDALVSKLVFGALAAFVTRARFKNETIAGQ